MRLVRDTTAGCMTYCGQILRSCMDSTCGCNDIFTSAPLLPLTIRWKSVCLLFFLRLLPPFLGRFPPRAICRARRTIIDAISSNFHLRARIRDDDAARERLSVLFKAGGSHVSVSTNKFSINRHRRATIAPISLYRNGAAARIEFPSSK